MTSAAVARGIVQAAADHETARQRQKTEIATSRQRRWRTAATLGILAFGLLLALTNLRGISWLRIMFQAVLIGYLGLVSGELLSLAMFVGWAQSGIPWQNAFGLVALAAAAIALPIAKGNNLYCSHLCPHGAAQQLLPRRWRIQRLPKRLVSILRLTRPLLLAWVVLVAAGNWPFNLVNIEPFDAYSAAWPTTIIAVVGLLASLFAPMGYCRYGCPTGAVLEYLRRHGRSDLWTRADLFAVACLLVALMLVWLPRSGAAP
jgi:polyferredoxin